VGWDGLVGHSSVRIGRVESFWCARAVDEAFKAQTNLARLEMPPAGRRRVRGKKEEKKTRSAGGLKREG